MWKERPLRHFLMAALHQLTLPRLLFFAMASGLGAAVSMPMGQRLGRQGPRLVILADGLILLASALWLNYKLRLTSTPVNRPSPE